MAVPMPPSLPLLVRGGYTPISRYPRGALGGALTARSVRAIMGRVCAQRRVGRLRTHGGKGMLAAHLCLDLHGLKRIRLHDRQGEVGGTLATNFGVLDTDAVLIAAGIVGYGGDSQPDLACLPARNPM